jgi:hypothetical protein
LGSESAVLKLISNEAIQMCDLRVILIIAPMLVKQKVLFLGTHTHGKKLALRPRIRPQEIDEMPRHT